MKLKKGIISSLLFLIIFSGIQERTYGQNQSGQIVVNGGIGFSLPSLVFKGLKNAINFTGESTGAIPNLGGNVDLALHNRFSLGLGYSYQSMYAEFSGYDIETDTGTVTLLGAFRDDIVRQNFGLRAFFHFTQSEEVDVYSGFRLSYTDWTHTTNRENRPEEKVSKWIMRDGIKFQFLTGVRYFFHPNIGAHLELGIGAPYFLMTGISFRFGGMN